MHIPPRVGEVNTHHAQPCEYQVNKLRGADKQFIRYLCNLGAVKTGGENQHNQGHADHLAYNTQVEAVPEAVPSCLFPTELMMVFMLGEEKSANPNPMKSKIATISVCGVF